MSQRCYICGIPG